MVFAGQDKWRRHPLIFETWRRPFPMLGTSCVIFACLWMGEVMYNGYKKRNSDTPQYRFIKNSNGETILQKKIVKPHHHEFNHVHGIVRVAPEMTPILNADGEEMTMEERLRFSYDEMHMKNADANELCLTKHLEETVAEA